jgi:hypothetical protein
MLSDLSDKDRCIKFLNKLKIDFKNQTEDYILSDNVYSRLILLSSEFKNKNIKSIGVEWLSFNFDNKDNFINILIEE